MQIIGPKIAVINVLNIIMYPTAILVSCAHFISVLIGWLIDKKVITIGPLVGMLFPAEETLEYLCQLCMRR